MISRYANPRQFLLLSERLLPWVAAAAILGLGAGLALALIGSPADYQQGETVRIMYVHVPSAWLAMLGYATVALSSAVGLIWKHPLADLSAKAASPVGAAFTLVCLVSGALWGKPMWGAWWVWDARLTSMLILLFLYLGHMALLSAFDDPQRGTRAASILAIAGVVNLPVIKFSVDWWNTLHQPASVVKMGGPAIAPEMLWPLLVMTFGFSAFFALLMLLRVRTEILDAKLRNLRLAAWAQAAE